VYCIGGGLGENRSEREREPVYNVTLASRRRVRAAKRGTERGRQPSTRNIDREATGARRGWLRGGMKHRGDVTNFSLAYEATNACSNSCSAVAAVAANLTPIAEP